MSSSLSAANARAAAVKTFDPDAKTATWKVKSGLAQMLKVRRAARAAHHARARSAHPRAAHRASRRTTPTSAAARPPPPPRRAA